MFMQLSTAVMYGTASFLIVLVNKTVLTTHKFPSFMVLGLGQVVATILILGIGKMLKIVSFPGLARDTFWRVWPLPLFFIGKQEKT
jgi:solute carrier family 35 protein